MITMLNIDCMEYMKTVPDKYFDLAIVDPPYGLNIISKHGKVGATGAKVWAYKKWDSAFPTQEYFNHLFRMSKNQIIWGGNHFISQIQSPDTSCWIVWDKGQRNFSFADAELAWTSFESAVRIIEISRSNNPNKIHPTQKPVALYKWLLKNYAKPEMKILDTHGGSFSSAIACYDFGTVEYVGCELDKDYFDSAVKRFNYHKSQTNLFK